MNALFFLHQFRHLLSEFEQFCRIQSEMNAGINCFISNKQIKPFEGASMVGRVGCRRSNYMKKRSSLCPRGIIISSSTLSCLDMNACDPENLFYRLLLPTVVNIVCYTAPVREPIIAISLSVCVSVCSRAYL